MDISLLKNDGKLEAWVPFTSDTRVLLAYISPDDLSALMAEATTVEVLRGAPIEKLDDDKLDELFTLKAVKGWEGFTCGAEVFECNRENVLLLAKKYTGFRKFVRDKAMEFSNFVEKKKAEQEKK